MQSGDNDLLFVTWQPQARALAEKEGFKYSVAKTSFKANTKALAENEGDGLAKVLVPLSHNFPCVSLTTQDLEFQYVFGIFGRISDLLQESKSAIGRAYEYRFEILVLRHSSS